MSEGSLPPFKSIWLRRLLPEFRVLRPLGRPFGRLVERLRSRREPEVSPELSERVVAGIRRHAEAHAALFERAVRLREKAERLERAGTPSESARNRAGRAEEELESGLADLRDSFAASDGEDGRRAFDRELRRLFPVLRIPEARF